METKTMTSAAGQPSDSNVGVDFRETLRDLANDLLDSFYSEAPHANAYGTEYDDEAHMDATWFLGREDGADGAEDATGIDYWYRKYVDAEDSDNPRREVHRNNHDHEYIYGRYGWMDVPGLIDDSDRLRQLFESAVTSGFLNEADLERFDEALAQAERELREYREQFTLRDIAVLFEQREEETLRTLLATGDEESRVIWSLLHSRDAQDNVIDTPNPIETPVVSEEDQLMLVRTVRVFGSDEQPYAAVVGYDDTPDRFFVHRLNSDPDVRDEDTEWTPELVRDKMGFDLHLWEISGEHLPYGERVRVQGDLCVVRHRFETAYQYERDQARDSKLTSLVRDHAGDFFESHEQYVEHPDLHTNERYGRISVQCETTDDLKALQDDLDILEERVRNRQPDDLNALRAPRRQSIIEEILTDRLQQWVVEQSETTWDEIGQAADQEATETLTDTQRQRNDVIGNHTAILGPVADYSPLREFDLVDDRTQRLYTVPPEEDATGFIIHDEHEDKQLSLAPGIYEFRFLSGFETEFWMTDG